MWHRKLRPDGSRYQTKGGTIQGALKATVSQRKKLMGTMLELLEPSTEGSIAEDADCSNHESGGNSTR